MPSTQIPTRSANQSQLILELIAILGSEGVLTGEAELRSYDCDAYSPETYRRLQVVKAKYDPENLFRYSYNIPPAKNG